MDELLRPWDSLYWTGLVSSWLCSCLVCGYLLGDHGWLQCKKLILQSVHGILTIGGLALQKRLLSTGFLRSLGRKASELTELWLDVLLSLVALLDTVLQVLQNFGSIKSILFYMKFPGTQTSQICIARVNTQFYVNI